MATTQCPSIETRVPSKERSGPDDQTPSINKLVRPDNSYSYVIIEINIRYVILLKGSEEKLDVECLFLLSTLNFAEIQ